MFSVFIGYSQVNVRTGFTGSFRALSESYSTNSRDQSSTHLLPAVLLLANHPQQRRVVPAHQGRPLPHLRFQLPQSASRASSPPGDPGRRRALLAAVAITASTAATTAATVTDGGIAAVVDAASARLFLGGLSSTSSSRNVSTAKALAVPTRTITCSFADTAACILVVCIGERGRSPPTIFHARGCRSKSGGRRAPAVRLPRCPRFAGGLRRLPRPLGVTMRRRRR